MTTKCTAAPALLTLKAWTARAAASAAGTALLVSASLASHASSGSICGADNGWNLVGANSDSSWIPNELDQPAAKLWLSEPEFAISSLEALGPLGTAPQDRARLLVRSLARIEHSERRDVATVVQQVDSPKPSALGTADKPIETRIALAFAYFAANEHGPALAIAERALEDRAMGDSPAFVRSLAKEILVSSLSRAGRAEEAIELWRKERSQLESQLGCAHPYLQRAYRVEVVALRFANRYKEALTLAQHAANTSALLWGKDSRVYLLAQGLVSTTSIEVLGPHHALALEKELLPAFERAWHSEHWRTLDRLDIQAACAKLLGLRILEKELLYRAYKRSTESLGIEHPTTSWRAFRLADSLRANNLVLEALPLAKRAVVRIEELRSDQTMSSATRQALLGVRSFEPYKLLPQLLVETNNPSGALDASELAKGRTLAEALNLDTLAPIPRPAAASEQKIARNERVVSYFVALHSVLAFVVDAGNATHAIDLGKADEIKTLVDIYSQLLRKPEAEQVLWHWSGDRFALSVVKPDVSARRASREDLSRLLYTKLLAPLEKHLAGAAHIAISPDEWLAMLPFESLLACSGAVCTPWANRVTMSTTPSLAVRSLLAQRQTRYSGLRRSQSLIAFGAPDYATAAERRHPRPVTLRHSGMEAEQVRRMFAPTRSRAWLGERASEATLRDLVTRGVLQDARVLHVAAHGEINLRKPELSAIELSASGLGLDEDGRITALDWAQFKLRTDLVILSGCSTGTGKILRGEGVLGLPYALFVAGTNGAILTLWQVPDDGAARFVVHLMRHVRDGKSPATALALTKRWYMKRYPNDLTWAAFQYYGA